MTAKPNVPEATTDVLELNVGGTSYLTTRETLLSQPKSIFEAYFSSEKCNGKKKDVMFPLKDNVHFVDRDGLLFRYILDFFRNGKLVLPESFLEIARLKEEATFYQLPALLTQIPAPICANAALGALSGDKGRLTPPPAPTPPPSNAVGRRHSDIVTKNASKTTGGCETIQEAEHNGPEGGNLTIGYRGTFAFGRDGQADVKFRKLNRILVCGKSSLCQEVFGDLINNSRDPDRVGENRYTSRLYLKHNSLEAAFDLLTLKGFRMTGATGSGASASMCISNATSPNQDMNLPRTTGDSEESKWNHYNEFVFFRPYPYIRQD